MAKTKLTPEQEQEIALLKASNEMFLKKTIDALVLLAELLPEFEQGI